MKTRYFKRAQELCRLAQLTGSAPQWNIAMRLLKKACL